MAEPRILGLVLAGGKGKRLAPLTEDRAKPAVPFGGLYRLIDFALSNLVNAGVLRIAVLTQYKSHSLDRHITTTWRMSNLLGNYVTPGAGAAAPGPALVHRRADAIFQSLNLIHDDRPDIVVVFGADHVYRMDPRQMSGQHIDGGAGVTVAAMPVPRREASAFGVIPPPATAARIEAFLEKPADPPGCPAAPTRPTPRWATTSSAPTPCSTRCTPTRRTRTAARHGRRHRADARRRRARRRSTTSSRTRYPARRRDRGYWRDVGTIDSYFEAHMDLCATVPAFNLYNDRWPILTHIPSLPPAKFVHDDAKNDRIGTAVDSIVQRRDRLGRVGAPIGALARGTPAQLGVGRSSVLMDSVDSAARRSSATRSSTRT